MVGFQSDYKIRVCGENSIPLDLKWVPGLECVFSSVNHFPKGDFTSDNFPNVQFPKQQLPKGSVRRSEALQTAIDLWLGWVRGQALWLG